MSGKEQQVELESDVLLGGPKFHMPVYMQRYCRVCEEIKNASFTPKKIVDFGCAECSLLQRLKNIDGVQTIIGVDIDRKILESAKHRIQPLVTDFICQRTSLLSICLYHGDITDFDSRLTSADIVTLVEVIEHLSPDVLNIFPHNVFEFIQPRLVIITTPNAEFNVLFDNCGGFRHWDHKFEWTRAQFQDWCEEIITLYPAYSVKYDGIGEPPSGSEDVGCCSQMAVFTRINEHMSNRPQQQIVYELVTEVEYPWKKPASKDSQLLNEIFYYTNILRRDFASFGDLADGDCSDNVDKDDIAKLPQGSNCEFQIERMCDDTGTFESKTLSCDFGNCDASGTEFVTIPLYKLLAFPRIAELCDNNVQILSQFIVEHNAGKLNKSHNCLLVPSVDDLSNSHSDSSISG